MMTLNQAINRCYEFASAQWKDSKDAEEQTQFAEWFEELELYRATGFTPDEILQMK